jgi:hypothetical protein
VKKRNPDIIENRHVPRGDISGIGYPPFSICITNPQIVKKSATKKTPFYVNKLEENLPSTWHNENSSSYTLDYVQQMIYSLLLLNAEAFITPGSLFFNDAITSWLI